MRERDQYCNGHVYHFGEIENNNYKIKRHHTETMVNEVTLNKDSLYVTDSQL